MVQAALEISEVCHGKPDGKYDMEGVSMTGVFLGRGREGRG